MIFHPSEPAPAGLYEELDAAGVRTGVVTFVQKGACLPGAPRGFTWQLLTPWPSAELLAKAAKYRRLATTSVTMEATSKLLTIAERLEARAQQKPAKDSDNHPGFSPIRRGSVGSPELRTGVVQSRIRTTSGKPPRYYYEIWSDLGGGCRLAIKTSPEFTTKAAAQRACEAAMRRYQAI